MDEEIKDILTLMNRCFDRSERVVLITDQDEFSSGRFALSAQGLTIKRDNSKTSRLYDWHETAFVCHEGYPIRELKGADGSSSILSKPSTNILELLLNSIPILSWTGGFDFIPDEIRPSHKPTGVLDYGGNITLPQALSRYSRGEGFFGRSVDRQRFLERDLNRGRVQRYTGIEINSAKGLDFTRRAVPVVNMVFGDPFYMENVSFLGSTPYSAIFQAEDGAIGMLYTKTPVFFEVEKEAA